MRRMALESDGVDGAYVEMQVRSRLNLGAISHYHGPVVTDLPHVAGGADADAAPGLFSFARYAGVSVSTCYTTMPRGIGSLQVAPITR